MELGALQKMADDKKKKKKQPKLKTTRVNK